MPYSQRLTRANPGCIVFLIDQSASMSDRFEVNSKAKEVEDILNRTLNDLIPLVSGEDGVRDYVELGVIGYSGDRPSNALSGALAARLVHPISVIDANPLRVEDRLRKVPDGAGGILELSSKFPVWYTAKANGATPMCEALTLIAELMLDWCDAHPDSYPPVVMHLTDGESTDGNPEGLAEQIRQISTNDGQVILMNVHISGTASHSRVFPDSEAGDSYGDMLFRMSSQLPEGMRTVAVGLGYQPTEHSRAYIHNSKAEHVVNFFKIGTTPVNTAPVDMTR